MPLSFDWNRHHQNYEWIRIVLCIFQKQKKKRWTKLTATRALWKFNKNPVSRVGFNVRSKRTLMLQKLLRCLYLNVNQQLKDANWNNVKVDYIGCSGCLSLHTHVMIIFWYETNFYVYFWKTSFGNCRNKSFQNDFFQQHTS